MTSDRLHGPKFVYNGRVMTQQQKQRLMADPVVVAKAKVVNELRNAITTDAISGAASATISSGGGSKSWSRMSVAERTSWYERMNADLNAYVARKYGIVSEPTVAIGTRSIVRS